MRTSTLLIVLAALVVLAAPVFGQESSSSSSSSSTAAVISSSTAADASSSSTGSTPSPTPTPTPTPSPNTNNGTIYDSSSSTGTNGVVAEQYLSITFPGDVTSLTNLTLLNQYSVGVPAEVASALGLPSNQVSLATIQSGSIVVVNKIVNLPANVDAAAVINSKKDSGAFPLLQTSTGVAAGQPTGAASTLSLGFAAVAVVLAALMQ